MGEYAKFQGRQVKIGTCEDMLYLRADQAHKVSRERGSVDPIRDAEQIRFRFPFPDEDQIEPGAFEAFRRFRVNFPEVTCDAPTFPIELEHGSIQFKHETGFLVSIPCPDGAAGREWAAKSGVRIARNGYSGGLGISQQKLVRGKLVLIVECIACHTVARIEELAEVKPIVAALVQSAEHAEWRAGLEANQIEARGEKIDRFEYVKRAGAFEREVARRILAGYTEPNYWTRNNGGR